jgi:hypothetical protein
MFGRVRPRTSRPPIGAPCTQRLRHGDPIQLSLQLSLHGALLPCLCPATIPRITAWCRPPHAAMLDDYTRQLEEELVAAQQEKLAGTHSV